MDEQLTKNQKILKAIVIGLGVLILGILMLIVGTIVYRLNQPDPGEAAGEAAPGAPLAAAPGIADLPLPDGAEIVEATLAGERLVLLVRMGEAEQRVYIIEADGNRVLRTYRHRREAP